MRTCVLMFTVLFATACATTDTEATDDISATTAITEVARVTTPDGGTWRFLELEPGDLVLWGVLPEAAATAPIDGRTRLSYVDIYRRLTTAPVPSTLLAAQARADAQIDNEPPDTSGLVAEASKPPKPDTSAVSASYFQDHYCSFNWTFYFCWPVFYGSPYVQDKAYSMFGHVAAVDHTVTFRMRYKKHSYSSWTDLSAQALPGQVHSVLAQHYAYRRWRRWEVLDNGNDLVRYADVGDK